MCITCMNTGRVFCHASRKPFGGSGSLREREQLVRPRAGPRPTPRPSPARRARACRTDCRAPGSNAPFGFSNSSAGPPVAARGRRSRSSRGADRLPRRRASTRRGVRAARGSREGRRISSQHSSVRTREAAFSGRHFSDRHPRESGNPASWCESDRAFDAWTSKGFSIRAISRKNPFLCGKSANIPELSGEDDT